MHYAYEHMMHHVTIILIGVRSSFPEIELNEEKALPSASLQKELHTQSDLYSLSQEI
jgi:hypothetical protein